MISDDARRFRAYSTPTMVASNGFGGHPRGFRALDCDAFESRSCVDERRLASTSFDIMGTRGNPGKSLRMRFDSARPRSRESLLRKFG